MVIFQVFPRLQSPASAKHKPMGKNKKSSAESGARWERNPFGHPDADGKKERESGTVPYEGGTKNVPSDGAGYEYGGYWVENDKDGYRREGRKSRDTEAAADFFAGAMITGADPQGCYTGSGLTMFGSRPLYFPPHDDEIVPVQDADDL